LNPEKKSKNEADATSGCAPVTNEDGMQKLLMPADFPDFMELLT